MVMSWLESVGLRKSLSPRCVPIPHPPQGYEVVLTLPIPGPIDSKLARIKRGILVPVVLAGYCLLLSRLRRGYWKRSKVLLAAEWLLSLLPSNYLSEFLLTPPHEALHGLALWAYTGDRPLVSMRVRDGWAYAAAPKWWFPRDHYLVVLLLPVSALTPLMLVLMPVTPTPFLALLGWSVTRHVAESNADLYVAWRLLKRPDSYLHDTGKVFTFWEPKRPE